jgi:hypothetical protein
MNNITNISLKKLELDFTLAYTVHLALYIDWHYYFIDWHYYFNFYLLLQGAYQLKPILYVYIEYYFIIHVYMYNICLTLV